MLSLLQKSVSILREAKLKDDRILVGFSGGKDSLATLDLCIKVFGRDNVYPFFMEFLPGLKINDEILENGVKRFNLKNIIRIPAPNFLKDFKSGLYGWEGSAKELLPDISRKDMFIKLVYDTGINNLAVGIKKADNLQIRRQWDNHNLFGAIAAPIWEWKALDVLKYCELNKIPVSRQSLEGFRGLDLSDESLLYINEKYPEDFKIIEEYFPFCGAKVFQYKHYKMTLKKHFV